METQPGDVVGGFELERKLGVGGMAAVWLAHPLSPHVPYARVVLKQMHPWLAGQKKVRELFIEEARLARGISHPNVVRVIDCGTSNGEAYIAMEYVDGVDLRSAMAAHGGPLWPALACALVADACAGLHHAHQCGVVHRDISPDNIMVDRKGQVRLLDFGVARAESTELTTLSGLRKGKSRYMAPEYLNEHVTTPLSDVYAMGLTLHELLTAHPPFSDVIGTAGLFAAILTRGPQPADALRPSLPKRLVALVAHAVARNPKDRPKSAQALEHQLRDFTAEYRPPSREEIGEEVQVWKQKLAAGPVRQPRRMPGSFGQLESTEMVKLDRLELAVPLGAPLEQNVFVAHQLDDTRADHPVYPAPDEVTNPLAPFDDLTDPETAPQESSVVLPPELEAIAVRSRKRSKTKKRKAVRKKS